MVITDTTPAKNGIKVCTRPDGIITYELHDVRYNTVDLWHVAFTDHIEQHIQSGETMHVLIDCRAINTASVHMVRTAERITQQYGMLVRANIAVVVNVQSSRLMVMLAQRTLRSLNIPCRFFHTVDQGVHWLNTQKSTKLS